VDAAHVVDTLRRLGAHDIERAEGTWRDGDWVDFNPLAPAQLIDADLREA
jgi:hypothetical protein